MVTLLGNNKINLKKLISERISMTKLFLTLLQVAISILCGILAYNDINQNYHFSSNISWILIILGFLIPLFLTCVLMARIWHYQFDREEDYLNIRLAIGFIVSIISLPYISYRIWVNIEYPILKWLILAIIAMVIIFLSIMNELQKYQSTSKVAPKSEERKFKDNVNNPQIEDNISNIQNSNYRYKDTTDLSIPKSLQILETEKHNLYISQVEILFKFRLYAVGVVSLIMLFFLYHIIDITQQSADHNLLVQILLKQTNLDIHEIRSMAVSYLTEKELIAITALGIITFSSLAVLIKVFLSPISTNIHYDDKLKLQSQDADMKLNNATISQKIVDAILNNAISNKNDKTR